MSFDRIEVAADSDVVERDEAVATTPSDGRDGRERRTQGARPRRGEERAAADVLAVSSAWFEAANAQLAVAVVQTPEESTRAREVLARAPVQSPSDAAARRLGSVRPTLLCAQP